MPQMSSLQGCYRFWALDVARSNQWRSSKRSVERAESSPRLGRILEGAGNALCSPLHSHCLPCSLFSFPKLLLWHCLSCMMGGCFGTGSKWINPGSAAALSWDQTNPGSSSFYSSMPKSRIWFRCFVWSYLGKLLSETIFLPKCIEFWIISDSFDQRNGKKNPVLVLAASHRKGWMSLQWRKHSSVFVAFKVFNFVLQTWSRKEQWCHGNLCSF